MPYPGQPGRPGFSLPVPVGHPYSCSGSAGRCSVPAYGLAARRSLTATWIWRQHCWAPAPLPQRPPGWGRAQAERGMRPPCGRWVTGLPPGRGQCHCSGRAYARQGNLVSGLWGFSPRTGHRMPRDSSLGLGRDSSVTQATSTAGGVLLPRAWEAPWLWSRSQRCCVHSHSRPCLTAAGLG